MPAGVLGRGHLVVHHVEASRQQRAAVEDDVDLVGAVVHRAADLVEALLQVALPRREGAGHRRHLHARARRVRRAPRRPASHRRTPRRRAPWPGRPGSGRRARAQRARTLPGVSAPSRVVRSMQRAASSRPAALLLALDRARHEARRPPLEGVGVNRRHAHRAIGEGAGEDGATRVSTEAQHDRILARPRA